MAPITPSKGGVSPVATAAGTGLASVVRLGNVETIDALEAARTNLGRPLPLVPVDTLNATRFSATAPALTGSVTAVPDPLAILPDIGEPGAAIGSALALAPRVAPVRTQLIEIYAWTRQPSTARVLDALEIVAELAATRIDVGNEALVRRAAHAVRDVVVDATSSVVRDPNTAADLMVRPVAFWAALTQLSLGISRGRVEENSLYANPWRGTGAVFHTYASILAEPGVHDALGVLSQIGIARLFDVAPDLDLPVFRAELDDTELLMQGVLDDRGVVRKGLPMAREAGQLAGGEIEAVGTDISKDDMAFAVAQELMAKGYDVELVGEGEQAFFEFDPDKKPSVFLKEYWKFQSGAAFIGFDLLRGTASTMIRPHRYNSKWGLVTTDPFEAREHIKDPRDGEDSLGPARIEGAARVAGHLGVGEAQLQELVHNRVVGKVNKALEQAAGVEIQAEHVLMIKGGEELSWIVVKFLPTGEAVATGKNCHFNAPGQEESHEYRLQAKNVEKVKAHLVEVAQSHPGFLRKDSPIREIRVSKDGRYVGKVEFRYEEHPAYEVVTSPLPPGDYGMILAVATGLARVSRGTSQHDAFGVHVHAQVDTMTAALNVIKAFVRRRKAMLRFLSPEKGRRPFMAAYTPEYIERVLQPDYLMDLDQYKMPAGMSVTEMQTLVGVADYVTGARPKYAEVNAEPCFDFLCRLLFGTGRLRNGQLIEGFKYRGRHYTFTPHQEDLKHGKYGVTVSVQGVATPVDWPTNELIRSPRAKPIPTLEIRMPNTSEADGKIDPQTVLENLQYWPSFVALHSGSPANQRTY